MYFKKFRQKLWENLKMSHVGNFSYSFRFLPAMTAVHVEIIQFIVLWATSAEIGTLDCLLP